MQPVPLSSRGRILGIGGIFFKSPDAPSLRNWYQEKLGIISGPEGATFGWRAMDQTNAEYFTVWAAFPSNTKYFDPGPAPFMINYIVDDLDAMLSKLQAAGVTIDPKRDDHEYGRFAWIYDCDGNKVELWEPPATTLEATEAEDESAA